LVEFQLGPKLVEFPRVWLLLVLELALTQIQTILMTTLAYAPARGGPVVHTGTELAQRIRT
jgi:hypothetical protein